MKEWKTAKSAGEAEMRPGQMDKINRWARRALSEDEVFVFSVVLCDNDVDRDGERFPRKSLDKLAELFLGKTGVFDHSARAESQSARIFDTEVQADGDREVWGEPYCRLKAWAYMARCDKNADLIFEIDAGIKKEVSVGCAVKQVVCSVCGAEQNGGGCGHDKGEHYGGEPCHHLLVEPTDAYEWSFVAVPAQKAAGVVKGYRQAAGDAGVLQRLKSAKGPVELSRGEAERLWETIQGLRELAKSGEGYLEELRRDVVRLAGVSQPGLNPSVLEEVCGRMELRELKAFREGFAKSARGGRPGPQLVQGAVEETGSGHPFKV